MEVAAGLQEGQGEAPGLQRVRTRANDASSTLAMVHDAADSDSETEAVQEAATIPGGGAGFGAENDVPPASEREVSVVSNASNGGGSLAATDDDASLVQGAAHSAFAGGGRPQQAASEVQGGAAAGAAADAQAAATGEAAGEAPGGEIQSSGRAATAAAPAAASTFASPAGVPAAQPPLDPPSAAAQLAGTLSIAERSASAAAVPTIALQPAASENASAQGGGPGAAAAAPAGRGVGPAESVGMPAPTGSVGMAVPQAQARGLPRRDLQPGFSLNSGAAASGQPRGGNAARAGNAAAREAASRPPPAPRRAASADMRGAASTDAQIGSVAPGREAAAADDAAATLSVSAAHSQDSQAGSRGGEGTPRGPSTVGQSGLAERPPPAARPSQSGVSGQSPIGGRAPSGSGAGDSAAAAGVSRSQRPQQSRKRKRPASPADEIAFAIRDAARDRDPLRALAEYDRGIAEGIDMKPDSYASLLYLCAGGDGWEARARARADDPEQAAPAALANGMDIDAAPAAPAAAAAADAVAPAAANVDYQMLYQRGREVFESMQQKGLSLSETAYTALARMAASAGDGAAALAAAQEMVAAGITPRLRSFTPALLAFSTAGQVDQAFGVADTLAGLNIDLTEPEFAALLHSCQFDAGWARAEALLRRMGRELTTLSAGTLATARVVFGSPAATAAFAEGGPLAGRGASWQVADVTVDAAGRESGSNEQLSAFDLDDGEWTAFSEGIARLASEQERKANDFETFQRWLDANGPFGCVIDGANVALFGQNFAEGGFDFGQIEAAMRHVRERHPDLKPLVVLHAGRTKGPKAAEPRAAQLLSQWRSAKTFYTTPFGSNDDWYWMYAAVRAGRQGLLVSNDEMRDHIFQLLAPKFFFKWKQRHQVHYGFDGGRRLTTEYPPPYSTAAQQLPSGAWLLPGSDGTWLAARPAAA